MLRTLKPWKVTSGKSMVTHSICPVFVDERMLWYFLYELRWFNVVMLLSVIDSTCIAVVATPCEFYRLVLRFR